MIQYTLTQPDDWHLHLRDGATLSAVVGHSARQFGRALIMPNLAPPVTSTAMALAYRARILAALPEGTSFNPLMSLYLTDSTPPGEIALARDSGHVVALKYYPAGATTHSASGVTRLHRVYAVLATMEEHDLPLLVHGEVTDADVDIFDRERIFIERELQPLVERFPALRIVFEHVTTREGVDFVLSASPRIAATITAHHLLLNRNAMLVGGMRPHHFCLPVLKRESHRLALIAAATSGNPKFFLGTDSAPHAKTAKESACGCAGIFTAHAAIELYAEVFDKLDALDRLEGFASFFGADFYQLPRNLTMLTLSKQVVPVPGVFRVGEDVLIPFRAGGQLEWSMTLTC